MTSLLRVQKRIQLPLLFLVVFLALNTLTLAQDNVSFAIGDTVIVKGGAMTLYTRPGGGTRLTDMPDNTVSEIVAGPDVVNGLRWWYITNNYGWVAEADPLGGVLLPYDPAILEQSISTANSVLSNDPNNVDALFRRGWAYFNQERYNAASEDLAAAIALEPENAKLHLASGKVHLDAGQYVDAIQDLSVALVYMPDDVAAHNRRGVALEGLADYQSATLDYLTGLEIAPEYGLLYYNLGNVARDADNDYLALDYYAQALSTDPNLHQVHIGRGYAYVTLGNYDAALAEFAESMRHFPDKYYPYAGLGTTYEYMGDLQTALNYYEQALSYETENAFLYRSRGRLYYKLGRFEESADDLAHAIEYARDPAEEYNSQGSLYSNLGDYLAAVERYTKAVELGYQYAHWAIYNRGLIYKQLGDSDAALADFDDALKLQPYFPAPYIARGNLLIDLGDYDEALQNMDEAIALFPNLAPLYFQRGIINDHYLNRLERALTDYEQAAELNPYEPDYLLALGNQYYDLAIYDEALAAYEQYIALIGDSDPDRAAEVQNRVDFVRGVETRVEESQLEPLSPKPVQDSYDTAGQVLYGWDQGVGSIILSLVQADESPVQIAPETDITALTWSPDGQRIAFADLNGVYLMTPDGGSITRLIATNYPRNLRFSPDGRQIAYSASGHIWRINLDGSDNTNLTANVGGYEYLGERGLDWSADGEHIVFSASPKDTQLPNGIFQINVDGSDMSILFPWPRDNIHIESLRLSPDGRHIAVNAIQGINSLFLINLEDNSWHLLPPFEQVRGYAWSPDGQQIAYNLSEEIYVIGVEPDASPDIIDEGLSNNQIVFDWSLDGHSIVFTACTNIYTCQLYTINQDGGGLTQLTDNDGVKKFAVISPTEE